MLFTGCYKKEYSAIFTNLLLNVQQNIKKRQFWPVKISFCFCCHLWKI
ncbi:Uncharacterised protein [Neisseria animaloris]|uniref:Uncharacterized protein n=1 Tax=Neisseria animaloris TaxID=326522 RepID=A0A3S5F6M1_9NEIS|nr:Uncharacterised protein [Neisseria animaloris]VEJ21921.1 Uncharacterised protein [Neisseria animaloris]